MQGDFFQVLRRVQKEERNKSSLARVDNEFYKQLRDYIKDLERSVANDPFGNEQLLLNNAQRIATEICELRESKITKAANNNIYRSFLLFKKDNPQFDLLDTTPLNLTDEEETLYFSLMDALKNHRYRISLDEYKEDSTTEEDYEEEEDFDEDEESTFVEDSYESSSIESESSIDDGLEDEISDALGESGSDSSGDEVLDRLNQIKDAKVITDEKYENIDKQIANQKYPGQSSQVNTQNEDYADSSEDVYVEDDSQFDLQAETHESGEEEPKTIESKAEVQSSTQSPKKDSFSSGNIEDILNNPDSQFVDLDNLEPDYNDDYYNAIAAGSSYAQPNEDDFNLIFAKPKKPKADQEKTEFEQSKPEVKEEISEDLKPEVDEDISGEFKPKVKEEISEDLKPEIKEETYEESAQSELGQTPNRESVGSDLGFSSGLSVKEEKTAHANDFNKAIEKDTAPKKPVDKTRGGVFAKDEIENATVVISDNVGEMVGIDGKVYGPFLENDVVILPNITAQILINNNKATLIKY